MPKTAVIGAGVSGLAAAIHLARAGHDVVVFEQGSRYGGKMGEIRFDGFRFDTGPSLFTWPELMAELLTPPGTEEGKAWEKLDLITRYFWDDGKCVDAHADPHTLSLELQDKLGEDPARVRTYLAECETLFRLTKPVFLEKYPMSARAWLSRETLRALPKLPSLKAWESLHHYNRKFFRNPATVQLFDRYATYNGSNPYQAPATLRVIAHLEHNEGAFFPGGGMYSLATRLYEKACALGVIFRFNHPVKALQIHKSKVVSLEAEDHIFPVEHVVSTIDIMQLSKLLPGKQIRCNERKLERFSSSALVFFWGMNQPFPELSLHNVFFSNDYQAEFNAYFNQGRLSDDLTIYLYISSKRHVNDAPGGMENWFVMVNAPVNQGQDWDSLAAGARKVILQRLNKVLGKEIEPAIIVEKFYSPRDLQDKTGASLGAIYGQNSNSIFAAFQRHPNRLPSVKNLALAGGTVHPGGGIPLCLLSARLATNLILQK